MQQRELIDAAVELNLVPSEYLALWDELGAWQLDALRAAGLRPHHRLLDVGCGAMGLGLRAVAYLDPGNYYGVDASPRTWSSHVGSRRARSPAGRSSSCLPTRSSFGVSA